MACMLAHTHAHTEMLMHTPKETQYVQFGKNKSRWTHVYIKTLPVYIHNHKQTLLHTFTSSHTHACPHTHNRGPLIAGLSNNHDASSWGALAGFAFHTSLLFKDTQGREWNHLSQREAQRLEAPPAEKPVYFGWQNTLGYGCLCTYTHVRTHVWFGVCTHYIHFCFCARPKDQLRLSIN